MEKRIAIIRGINVGGRRKILMADLKELFSLLGYKGVTTYIQSGNVIFQVDEKQKNREIETGIETAIKEKYGFDVPVILRTEAEWDKAIKTNPFAKTAAVENLHLTFIKEIPKEEYQEKINTYDYSPDKFEIIGNNAFVFCAGRYSKSKLTNKFFESKLKTTTTTRNWKTVLKLSELIKAE